ncbi:MAG TPA: hypothetical protein VGY77_01975, partial [Gemmataceae bacterium]|nr:hypothetical protein [Gemmataceae bacterium]
SVILILGILFWQIHHRNIDRWLGSYLTEIPKRRYPSMGTPIHVLLCITDHFEPKLGNPPAEIARLRVKRWMDSYPRLFGKFRDSDGRPPRHTFFYPIDQYIEQDLEDLADLCRAGFGEVEIHLHHDGDTPESLRAMLLKYKDIFGKHHGLLSRRRNTGELVFGFIHGNWALNNSRPDGRWCGVNNEIAILRETGCFADFTLPSVPSPTQTRKINSSYFGCGDPHRPRGHDWGIDVGTGPAPANSLMLIQGPLLLNWKNRKWGLLPRIENGCLQGGQDATISRLDLWLKARVQVSGRPDWFFVKLHTHGANEGNEATLLGEPMVRFHQELARRARDNPNFHYHYLTAREMYNLARAAEAGWKGSIAEARDYEIVPNSLTPGVKEKCLNAVVS